MFQVVCIGESMVVITTRRPGSLTSKDAQLVLHVGGAESNVAMGIAQLGFASAWWGRIGEDPFGEFVMKRVSASGAHVSTVSDSARPTGVYFKDIGSDHTRVSYYRQGSAASGMLPTDVTHIPPWSRIVHLTGITPAISPTADDLVSAIFKLPRDGGKRVSFDVNYREPLWSADRAAPRLAELAREADIVFVGLDEAQMLWDIRHVDQLRELFPNVEQLVVKNGAENATVLAGNKRVTIPAPRSTVFEVVGAGDAFAAGYLAAMLDGEDLPRRLMAGHLSAKTAIQDSSDAPALPPLRELMQTATSYWLPGRSAECYSLVVRGHNEY